MNTTLRVVQTTIIYMNDCGYVFCFSLSTPPFFLYRTFAPSSCPSISVCPDKSLSTIIPTLFPLVGMLQGFSGQSVSTVKGCAALIRHYCTEEGKMSLSKSSTAALLRSDSQSLVSSHCHRASVPPSLDSSRHRS